MAYSRKGARRVGRWAAPARTTRAKRGGRVSRRAAPARQQTVRLVIQQAPAPQTMVDLDTGSLVKESRIKKAQF